MTAGNGYDFLAHIIQRSMSKTASEARFAPAITLETLPITFHMFGQENYDKEYSLRPSNSISYADAKYDENSVKLDPDSKVKMRKGTTINENLSGTSAYLASPDDDSNISLNRSNKTSIFAPQMDNVIRQKESENAMSPDSKQSILRKNGAEVKEQRPDPIDSRANLPITRQNERLSNKDLDSAVPSRLETHPNGTFYKSQDSQSMDHQRRNQTQSVIPPTHPDPQKRDKLSAAPMNSYLSASPSKIKEDTNNEVQGYSYPRITINIGRIEVRAVSNEKLASNLLQKQTFPSLSLNEYLRNRSQGRIKQEL